MGNPITCKLTGTVGPGIKAHIIPRSFYDFGGSEHKGAELLRIKGDDVRFAKSPVGEYDTGIVTEEGEAYFSEGDSYAYDCLVKKGQEAGIYMIGDEPGCVEIPEFDYPKLKLFFLSLLWRASVSSRPLFKKVALGPHEQRVRDLILAKDPGSSDDYATVVGIHRDTPEYGLPMCQPHPIRDNDTGFLYYKFSLGHLTACIKVDQRPAGEVWSDFVISPELPLRFLILEDMRSSDFYRDVGNRVRSAGPRRR